MRRKKIEFVTPPSFQAHVGEVCVILGAGPSLNDYDLSDPFFTENVTIASNAVATIFRPTYYVLTDPDAVKRYGEYAAVRQEQGTRYLQGCHIRDKNLKPDSVLYYDLGDAIGPPTLRRLYHGRTTGCLMTHLAYNMGFTHVFLLGVDGYSKLTGQKRFSQSTAPVYPSSDKTVANHLKLAVWRFRDEGKYLLSLSSRSIFPVPRVY